MEHLPETFILIMLAIVFLQSGIDKITDWKGNLGWLKGHFANSPFRNIVPVLLFVLTIFEVISGLTSVVGTVALITCGGTFFPLLGGIFSALTFLMLFLGQRIAKDYPGAQGIVVYFIPTVFLLYLLLN
ncbi:MAG TPA: hypothetical protein VKY36_01235 [Moheibacter sp.]|nr:hypothetical protein [Moheibacter sp.]